MIKKYIFFIIILLFSNFLSSQQYTIKYKYSSYSDSIIYNLNINKNSSVFEIGKYNIENVNIEKSNKKSDCDKFKVIRQENNIIVTDNIESAKVISIIPYNLKWKLEKGKKKFLKYNTKIASTIYDNKKWIAEYTTEIPINDGPFIFKFLPGLITKIESEDKEVLFQIVSIEKNSNIILCNTTQLKKIDFEKYIKVIHQKQEMENSLLKSLQNLPGIDIGNKKIEKIEYDPVKYLLK